jgi:tRNA threonylcarbamoyladenosine modification (KEOPS) complex  Pcc1 subunit
VDLKNRFGLEGAIDVAKEHIFESEKLYSAVLENSRNNSYKQSDATLYSSSKKRLAMFA